MHGLGVLVLGLAAVLGTTQGPTSWLDSGGQPPGIKSKIYNCTSPEDGLSLNVSGMLVVCGAVGKAPHTFRVRDITSRPSIRLSRAQSGTLYAAFLLNPIAVPGASFVSPILHFAGGNIPGEVLRAGQLGSGTIISKFFPPNPPVPSLRFQYVYLVFEQPHGPVDWSDVSALGTKRFPIQEVSARKKLRLVGANFFTAAREWFGRRRSRRSLLDQWSEQLESPPLASSSLRASSICVYNNAPVLLSWRLKSVSAEGGSWSGSTGKYPIWTARCLTASEVNQAKGFEAVSVNSTIAPFIQVVFGRENYEPEQQTVIYDPRFARAVTYVCTGSVLSGFSCGIAPPPPTAIDALRDIAAFVEGLVAGIATDLGFKSCLSDVNASFSTGQTMVVSMKQGIDQKSPESIAEAFVSIGKLVGDVADGLKDCPAASKALVSNLLKLAARMSSGALGVVRVVVSEVVEVVTSWGQITAECHQIVVGWDAGDYRGSGMALGQIVGTLVEGLYKFR